MPIPVCRALYLFEAVPFWLQVPSPKYRCTVDMTVFYPGHKYRCTKRILIFYPGRWQIHKKRVLHSNVVPMNLFILKTQSVPSVDPNRKEIKQTWSRAFNGELSTKTCDSLPSGYLVRWRFFTDAHSGLSSNLLEHASLGPGWYCGCLMCSLLELLSFKGLKA